MEIIEVINEFEDIPLEDRECMKETFSKALKKLVWMIKIFRKK